MCAFAFPGERDRRVERGCRVSCEKGGEFALTSVEILRKAARAHEQPELRPIRAQRDEND